MKANNYLKAAVAIFLFLLIEINPLASGPPNMPGFNPDVIRPVSSIYGTFHFGPSGFVNQNVNDLSGLAINHNSNPHVEFGYKRMLSLAKSDPLVSNQWRRFISWGFGMGYSQFFTDLTTERMEIIIEGTDITDVIPMDDVEWRIDFTEFKEEFKASFVYMPLFFEVGDINPETIGFFIRFGVNVNIPMENSFSGEGSFTSKGFYENYGLELGNIPELGFHTNAPLFSDQTDEYTLNRLFFSGVINAGISFPIRNKLSITLGGQYVFGITDPIKSASKTLPGEQAGSPVHDFKMVFYNGEPTRTRWYGFQLGLVYSLRDVF